jgi:hypothetical protein
MKDGNLRVSTKFLVDGFIGPEPITNPNNASSDLVVWLKVGRIALHL